MQRLLGKNASNNCLEEEKSDLSKLDAAVSLFRRTIFFALLVFISLSAIPYGTVEVWWVSAFESLVFVLGLLWCVGDLITGSWLVREGAWDLPLLLLVGFALFQAYPLMSSDALSLETGTNLALGTSISADPLETKRFAVKLIALLVSGRLLLHSASNQTRLRALIYTVIGIGFISAVFAITRQTMQRDAPSFFLPFLNPHVGYGQFINKNHFAFLMEMALGLMMGIIIGGGAAHHYRWLLYLALALPMWGALILANSRGGMFSALCQMLFLVLTFTFQRSAIPLFEFFQQKTPAQLKRRGQLFVFRAALIAGVIVLIGLSVVWIGSDPIVSKFEQTASDFSEEGSHANVGRRFIWDGTWRLFESHPLTGIGFGGYRTAITKYHDASGQFVPHQAHNDYLELLASGGLIGVILGIWLTFTFAREARKTLQSRNRFRRAACLGALAGIFAVAVHSFIDFGLHITINSLILVILIVIATAKLDDEKLRLKETVNAVEKIPLENIA